MITEASHLTAVSWSCLPWIVHSKLSVDVNSITSDEGSVRKALDLDLVEGKLVVEPFKVTRKVALDVSIEFSSSSRRLRIAVAARCAFRIIPGPFQSA